MDGNPEFQINSKITWNNYYHYVEPRFIIGEKYTSHHNNNPKSHAICVYKTKGIFASDILVWDDGSTVVFLQSDNSDYVKSFEKVC